MHYFNKETERLNLIPKPGLNLIKHLGAYLGTLLCQAVGVKGLNEWRKLQ
jgi:hypothetical protein